MDEIRLLLRRRPPSGTTVRSHEPAGAAAARETARTVPAQTGGGPARPRGAIWTDVTGAELPHDPAAGNDKSLGTGAASRTYGMGHPRSVESAASAAASAAFSASATFSRGTARCVGFGLASSCRLFSLDRPRRLPRTGHRLLVVADAAAGAAGLRERGGVTDRDGKGAEKGNSDLTLNEAWHQYYSNDQYELSGLSRPHTPRR